MDEVFRKLIDNNFADLAGLKGDVSIPVPENIVNEMIQAALRGNKNINDCRISIGGKNEVTIILKTPLWLWPINLKLRLEKSVSFTGSPMIRASLENNVLLMKLGSLFKALPDGINIQGSQVVVDIRSLLETPELRKLLDLVKSAEVRTEQARLILDVEIKVEEE